MFLKKKLSALYPYVTQLLTQCTKIDCNSVVYKTWTSFPDLSELLKLKELVTIPSVFRSRESEILPYLKGAPSSQFRAILGEPVSNEAKVILFSTLCRENVKEAVVFAESQHIPAEVVSQFLTTLETGSDDDRNNLHSYLNSLSYDEKISYWKDWMQKTKNPMASPLFPWVLNELKEKHNQSLFLGIVKISLPQAAHIIANLECAWIPENSSIVTRVLELLSKEKSGTYTTFLRRLIGEDEASSLPLHIKRVWDIDQNISSICALQPVLAKRGLKLSCVFPSMEKELSKPYGKALHEIKKQFDDQKFTRLVELCHPNHLDALTHIVINNPSWVSSHPDEAFHLFNRLVEAGKQASVQQYLSVIFKEGEATNLQDCVKKAWPLIRKAKTFLEFKNLLQSRGVSLSVIFRPLEEDVLKSLEEQKESAAIARDFFGTIETAPGKRTYLSLLMRGEKDRAFTYAKENRLEVDLIEMSIDSLSTKVLEEKTEWNRDETDRLWALAENALIIPLIQILLPRSREGFARTLTKISLNREYIKKAASLYPEIIKEAVSVALPFILVQTELTANTRFELPRLLKEANISEKISLLKWIKSVGQKADDFVECDSDAYKKEYENRVSEEAKFDELYSVAGLKPFEKFWEERSIQERVDIAKNSPFIFKRQELKHLLNSIREKIFESVSVKTLETLEIEPATSDQFFISFASPVLFDRFYPAFYENFGVPANTRLNGVEYRSVLDYLIKYKSRHILSALGYDARFCDILIERIKEIIDTGIPHLGSMETPLEKKFYNFAKMHRYVPFAILNHFININSYSWFKDGLDFVASLPPEATLKRDEFPLIVLKGIVRFEKEFSGIPTGSLIFFTAIFSTGVNHVEAFDCLRVATIPVLRETCVNHIIDILTEWKSDPKKVDPKIEERIGKYIADSIQRGTRDSAKFLYTDPIKSLLNDFPNLNNYYRVPLATLLLNQAIDSNSPEQKIKACTEVINLLRDYLFKNPDSASTLIDLYLSVLSELIDREIDINQIKYFTYSFLLMLINPESIINIQTTIGIPEIKSVKKAKNLAMAVSYVTKLLDILLSKKYAKQPYLYFALDTTQLLILWLLAKANDYSKQIHPLLKKRIYFIPSTPEFHYSEFVLVNQKMIGAADGILSHDQKAEYCFASNLKITENAPKLIPAKIEGFNRYALSFLSFKSTRSAQHVLNQLSEMLPANKQLRDIKFKEIFSGLIARATLDPKEPTATGVAFLLRVKEVFCDYFKAVHDLKEKEREKYLGDYLTLSHELVKAFYSVCDKIPEYLGIYSDFLTMIELENHIEGRYDAYFDMCDTVVTQWIKVIDELNGQALDPMTNLLLCQTDKLSEKFKKRQSQSMEKWFDILCAAKKQEYVRFLIDEFPAVTDICTEEMKKKYK